MLWLYAQIFNEFEIIKKLFINSYIYLDLENLNFKAYNTNMDISIKQNFVRDFEKR